MKKPRFAIETIRVDNGLLYWGASTYPIRQISQVSAITMPFEFGALVANGIGVIIGLILLSVAATWSVILSLPILAICAYNLYDMFSGRQHIVTIRLLNNDELNYSTKDYSGAQRLRDMIQSAISS